MFWIIELVIVFLLLPYILFGLLLAHIARIIVAVFEPHLLLFGAWLAGVGLFLLAHSVPDDSVEWVGIVDRLAQGHLFGLAAPNVAFGLAGFAVATAFLVALKARFKSS